MKYINYIAFALLVVGLFSCKKKSLEYDASGVFEVTEVVVSAKGNGELLQFNIEEGDQVVVDTPLGVIDTTQLYLKKLQLKASMSSVSNRKTSVSTQIAVLQEQIATQKRERTRFENLVKANAGNQKQLDDINSSIAVLERQLAAQYESINNSNNSLTDEHLSLQMQMDQINDLINNSVIYSPIDGTILSKYAEQGEFTAQGKPLFKVADITQMFLRAYITAGQLTGIKIGQEVNVYADMGEEDHKLYKGKVTWISDKAEFTPKTIQTRDERANLVYAIKVLVENDGYIKKGMYGEVEF